MEIKTITRIEKIIYIVREQKVMLDSDLAELYQVETKTLNQAVKRNIERFPPDFMFVCNSKELERLRSQFVTANPASTWNHKRRTSPMLFTEGGIVMLSTALNSDRAIQVNIAIIRTFIKLRSLLAHENVSNDKVTKLEKSTHKLFKIVFDKIDAIEEMVKPKLQTNRKKIGLKE
jgi:hypothetical protein